MLKTIRLTPEDVKHFVDVASKCDFDIDICYNRYVNRCQIILECTDWIHVAVDRVL